ncbi:MAG: putative PLP-dependent enzyme involved in cell wall biosis [Acidobacteria bacterium]|jgi:dTDP-4-amino-4,6-dideoxygalactose transaminase|nr:putative PLP-dependent enzyme involved in cell wall biosis [Acidobacteriota bacterium]
MLFMDKKGVPLLDLQAQYAAIRSEIEAAVGEVLASQKFILGPAVSALEKEIAQFCGTKHAVAVASGTDALLISLKALGVKAGDAVVTVPFTFFATAGVIVNLGARPVFVDIDEASFNMDPNALSHFLSNECSLDSSCFEVTHKASKSIVKAIVPVHLYGQCADMDGIRQMARRYHLPVVEDACQAIGAEYGGTRAGALGDVGCFSFFPTKNLGGAGDGGMITTSSAELAARIRLLRTHGAEKRYFHSIVGFNSRLDEIQAAILRVKLRHLEDWNRQRIRNAAHYEQEFTAAGLLPYLALPYPGPGRSHIYHQYVIRCKKRDQLQEYLRSREIGCEIYYPLPLHEQKCFEYLHYGAFDFPHSKNAAAEVLALPIYPELTEGQIACVTGSIADFYRQNPQ